MIEKIALTVLVVNVLSFIVLWSRDKNLLYAIFALSLLSLFGLTVAQEYTAEWRHYQHEFVEMMAAKEKNRETAQSIAETPIKIAQVWTEDLGVTDRCITCHMGYDNPAFKDAPEPFRYHEAAREHDFNKIGCTICHQGQGRATQKEQAHAYDIEHWEFPMWPINMVQVSCPKCHDEVYQPGYQLKGAEMLTSSRDITQGKNDLGVECTSCHTIRGVGEVLAPDLTEYGDRTEHEFEQTHVLKHVEGKKNMYNWTYQHFLDPAKVTPADPELKMEETIMPKYGFSPEQSHALTTYVFSFRQNKMPVKYLYRNSTTFQKKRGGEAVSFIAEYEKQFPNLSDLPPGQRLFIKSNCWFCHQINGKGGKISKDLSHVGTHYSKDGLKEIFAVESKMARHSLGAQQMKFTADQINALADYLAGLK